MKKGSCNAAMCGASYLRWFLGGYFLLAGLNMLSNYSGMVDFMLSSAGKPGLEALQPLTDVVAMAVAYSWPIVKTLVGLSFLTKFKKCIATNVLMVYLFMLFMGHMLAGDMGPATLVFVVVLGVVAMKGLGAMGSMCEKK